LCQISELHVPDIAVNFHIGSFCSFRDIRDYLISDFGLKKPYHAHFWVAHAQYHVTRGQGVKINHTSELFDPLFPIPIQIPLPPKSNIIILTTV